MATPHRRRHGLLLAATLALCVTTPAQASVNIGASAIGPASIVFDGLTGYGGTLGTSVSVPVRLDYRARPVNGPSIIGSNVAGLLDISFAVSPAAPRNFYPFVDPFVKQSNAREGARWVGNSDTMTVRLTILNGGNPLNLLSLTTTAPDARFAVEDFVTYHTDGRGLKLRQPFDAGDRQATRIQTGSCHSFPICAGLPGPDSFTLASDILQLDQTIRPDSYRGMVFVLGRPDASFTAGPDGAFTVPLRGLGFASAVPEPASWSMMIIGFGFVGHGLRRRNHARPIVQAPLKPRAAHHR